MARSALGLTYPEIYDSNRFGTGPDVTLTGFTAYNAGDYIRNRNLTYQVRDDVSKVAGSHALKFGGQVTYSQKDQNTRPRENGVVTFATSARNSTGNVVADALLGNFQNYTEGAQDQEWLARFWQYEFYAQDNWRVAKNADARSGRALQRHRAALQRAQQLLDVRSGAVRSGAGPAGAGERRVARGGNREPDQRHRHLRRGFS